RRERFGARGALAPAAAVGGFITVAPGAPLDAIRQAKRILRDVCLREAAGRWAALAWRAGQNLPLPHVAGAPIGVENLVKPLPVRVRRAEQRTQRGLERRWADGRRRSEHGQRVL